MDLCLHKLNRKCFDEEFDNDDDTAVWPEDSLDYPRPRIWPNN